MQFKNNFINLCKREDLTLDELILLLGVTQQDIEGWIKEENIPSIKVMQEIAKMFNVTVDDLVNIVIPIKTEDVKKVKRITKTFSILLGLSVFLIFFSIGLYLTINRVSNNYKEIGTFILIVGIIIGVFGIIVPTLNFESYCKNSYIVFEPTRKEVKASKDTFILKLLIGIILITTGIIQFIIIFINFNNIYSYSLAIMLTLIGLGIGLIIHGGIIMSMYTAPDEVFNP